MSAIKYTPVPAGASVDIFPTLVVGYETTRESGNIVHEILGRPDPVVTLRPARLRAGTLGLLFETETAAAACVDAHSRTGTFQFTDTDVSSVGMKYVVNGSVRSQLDDSTLTLWMVAVDYQEVL